MKNFAEWWEEHQHEYDPWDKFDIEWGWTVAMEVAHPKIEELEGLIQELQEQQGD